ncbi:hypothetical protein J3F83DRAFT_726684 [Trichoderma novae-zelandiae]
MWAVALVLESCTFHLLRTTYRVDRERNETRIRKKTNKKKTWGSPALARKAILASKKKCGGERPGDKARCLTGHVKAWICRYDRAGQLVPKCWVRPRPWGHNIFIVIPTGKRYLALFSLSSLFLPVYIV